MSYAVKQKKIHLFVQEKFSFLLKSKKEANKEAFNKLLLEVLPEVRKYVISKLNRAIRKGIVSGGKYMPEDFLDQLFIEVYDNIEEVKKEKDFYLWLFRKVDKLVEDTLVEEEFDKLFFENIEKYSKPEWDEMEENYSVDAGGDLVLLEELDDPSYSSGKYVLKDIFIEGDELSLINRLDEKLSKNRISNHIDMVLHKLPLLMQNVFELYHDYGFEEGEIAMIKRISVQKVQVLLGDTKESVLLSVSKRYTA